MISIHDLRKLIMDLVYDELLLIQDQGGTNNSDDYMLFNFTQHNQVRILTKIQFNMQLAEKGEQLKESDKHMKLTDNEMQIKKSEKHMRWLEWSFKQFVSGL